MILQIFRMRGRISEYADASFGRSSEHEDIWSDNFQIMHAHYQGDFPNVQTCDYYETVEHNILLVFWMRRRMTQ